MPDPVVASPAAPVSPVTPEVPPVAPAPDAPPVTPEVSPVAETPPVTPEPTAKKSFFDGKDKTAALPADLLAKYPSLSKFKDVDSFAKSYVEAEKTMTELRKSQSKAPDAYDPAIVPKGLSVGPEVFDHFKTLGLTDAQAKGVLDASVDIVRHAEESRLNLERDRLMMERGMRTPEEFSAWIEPLNNMAVEMLGEKGAEMMGSSISGVLAVEFAVRERAARDQMPSGNPLARQMGNASTVTDLRGKLRSIMTNDPRWEQKPDVVSEIKRIETQITEMREAS